MAKKCKETSVGFKDGSPDLLTALPTASLNIPKPTWKNSAFPAAPAATTRPYLSVATRLSRTLNHADVLCCSAVISVCRGYDDYDDHDDDYRPQLQVCTRTYPCTPTPPAHQGRRVATGAAGHLQNYQEQDLPRVYTTVILP